MKPLLAIKCGLLIAALAVSGCGHRSPSMGWVTLVDGERGLENFNRIGDANWRAEGGAIVADKGKGGHLVTKESYKDFQIYAEFWADTTTNSGIFFRITDPNKVGTAVAYEANIYDQNPNVASGTGSLAGLASVDGSHKAGGKWNVYEIYAKGPELTVKLNGVVTVSTRDSKFASGPVSLQFTNGPKGAPGGPIKWRKVEIRPL
jgi:hypothetical protein